jgi:predicted ATPase/class 3 adenylate cyclase
VSVVRGGGTATLLFTDIEGSTRLARELGDRWADTVGRHHAILRKAIESNGGSVDGTEGDAFFALFDSARSGVAAAIDAQRQLGIERWPGSPVKVRMGLHTGEVRHVQTGFVGIDIHRAARVAASAHGGQVLLTQTTVDLAGGDIRTEDLGLHRLKDFPDPERLFHLVIDDRTSEQFPPPKTLRVRPTNVPTLEAPIVGRRSELKELHDRLADGTRVLTLTGPGGAGKTRLALAAAEELLEVFPGGTWLVPLSDVDDADRILAVIADKLRIPEGAGQTMLDVLAERLQAQSTLLVLDNLEHIRDASAVIRELLAVASPLKVLITSQAPLRIAGEHVLPLAPLPAVDGRKLFVQVASERRRDLDPDASAAAIDAICKHLDGLPLAIELAAARTVALSPEELLERLIGSLELLRAREPDRPERHRSLRATLEWSFALLSPEARELCAALSLFATAFVLSDAEAVGEGDVLEGIEQLLDFSFLRRVAAGPGETRFTMAQTLRAFAHQTLAETGRLDSAQRQFANWAVAFAEASAAAFGSDPVGVSDRVLGRLDDMHVALAWAREQDPELHLRLTGSLSDALMWLPPGSDLDTELTIAVGRAHPPGPNLARAVTALGVIRFSYGDGAGAVAHLQRAADLWRQLDDRPRTIDALISLTYPAVDVDPSSARAYGEEALALAHELGDRSMIEHSTTALAQVEVATGHADRAEPLIADIADPQSIEVAMGLRHLWADCALIRGDSREAATRYAAAIRALPGLDENPSVIVELQGLAMSLAAAGRAEQALEVDRIATAYGEHFHRLRDPPWWAALLEQKLGPARASVPSYIADHPLDDLAAARDWALGLADELAAQNRS